MLLIFSSGAIKADPQLTNTARELMETTKTPATRELPCA